MTKQVQEPAGPAVELRGYFKYDSGSPYRVWTFTRDVPEVPALGQWVGDVDGPAYAIAGDELWEDREDRGLVFQLKRDDLVIGRPEWWQIRGPVFDGDVPAWKLPAETVAPEPQPIDEIVMRALPRGLRAYGDFSNSDPRGAVFVADAAIVGTPVVAGDLVFLREAIASKGMPKAERAAICGALIQMKRSVAPLLADAIDAGVLRRALDSGHHYDRDATWLRRNHARYVNAGSKWSDTTSPLYIIRPWRSPISAPIEAASDDAALFELVVSAGGRLTSDDSARNRRG